MYWFYIYLRAVESFSLDVHSGCNMLISCKQTWMWDLWYRLFFAAFLCSRAITFHLLMSWITWINLFCNSLELSRYYDHSFICIDWPCFCSRASTAFTGQRQGSDGKFGCVNRRCSRPSACYPKCRKGKNEWNGVVCRRRTKAYNCLSPVSWKYLWKAVKHYIFVVNMEHIHTTVDLFSQTISRRALFSCFDCFQLKFLSHNNCFANIFKSASFHSRLGLFLSGMKQRNLWIMVHWFHRKAKNNL